MSEPQKIGDILDGLGVTLDMDDGDLIARAMVLTVTVDSDGGVALGIATSEGLTWIDQHGLLAAAAEVVSGGYERRGPQE